MPHGGCSALNGVNPNYKKVWFKSALLKSQTKYSYGRGYTILKAGWKIWTSSKLDEKSDKKSSKWEIFDLENDS